MQMIIVMFAVAKPSNEFISSNPSFKILALSFILMIGVALLAEGFYFEIPKGYIYFSMAFDFFVDILQVKLKEINLHPNTITIIVWYDFPHNIIKNKSRVL